MDGSLMVCSEYGPTIKGQDIHYLQSSSYGVPCPDSRRWRVELQTHFFVCVWRAICAYDLRKEEQSIKTLSYFIVREECYFCRNCKSS